MKFMILGNFFLLLTIILVLAEQNSNTGITLITGCLFELFGFVLSFYTKSKLNS